MSSFTLRNTLKAFRKDENGTVPVETALLFPTILFCLFAMMNIFDAYRAKSTTEKAAFAVSDMLSRETDAVTPEYIASVHAILEEISTVRSGHSLQVSNVYMSAGELGQIEEYWSYSFGEGGLIETSSLASYRDMLPTLVAGESLIVVQTSASYVPPIFDGWDGTHSIEEFGKVDGELVAAADLAEDYEGDIVTRRVLSDSANPLTMDINTFVFTRPRFAPQLAWNGS